MFRSLKSLLIAAAVVAGTTALTLHQTPSVAQANDRYWNNHWNWYDRSYRPHYYQHQQRNFYGQQPGYGYGYGQQYQGYGYGQPYQAYRYGNAYPGYYGGGSGVRIGPLQFNWR